MQVKNPKYVAYLKGELMETIDRSQFVEKLGAIKHRHLSQARAIAILLWTTASRPNEVLELTVKDISHEGGFLKLKMKGSKGGYSAPILLPLKDPLVKEIDELTKGKFPDQYLFWAFRSKSQRKSTTKSFKKKNKEGSLIPMKKEYLRAYPQKAARLYYWFNRWFGIPPYYFRHNRLTLAAQRLDANQLMLLKRSRSMESIRPYIHMNLKVGKQIARELIK